MVRTKQTARGGRGGQTGGIQPATFPTGGGGIVPPPIPPPIPTGGGGIVPPPIPPPIPTRGRSARGRGRGRAGVFRGNPQPPPPPPSSRPPLIKKKTRRRRRNRVATEIRRLQKTPGLMVSKFQMTR